jgi:RNA polymerase sigma factor (sigma-70 family)
MCRKGLHSKRINKLEGEYKDLIVNNHNLIYKFLSDNHLPMEDTCIDWYGAAAEGLCNAAMIYDKSKGTDFTTVAYKSMYIYCGKEMRKTSNKIFNLSLDSRQFDDKTKANLLDIVADNDYVHLNIEYKDFVKVLDMIINTFNEQEQDIIRSKLYGETFVDIGKRYGLSRERIRQKYKKFSDKVQIFLNMQNRIVRNCNLEGVKIR